jgi:recombination protein RecT
MSDSLSISQFLQNDQVRSSVREILHERTPQFITSLISVASSNERLRNADRKSLLNAALTAAALNLPVNPNLGFAYIIPYNQKDGTIVAQFQMGYKGFIQLAIRSGQYKTINVSEVREGELKKIDRLSGEIKFKWIEENRNNLPVIGYVAYFKLRNGFSKILYMTKAEAKEHGLKYSQNYKKYGTGLWADDPDGMSKKTAVKLLLSKFGVLDTALEKAIESDQAVITDGSLSYPDNEESTPNELAAEKERMRIINFIKNTTSVTDLEECKPSIIDDEVRAMYDKKHSELVQKEGSQEEGQ